MKKLLFISLVALTPVSCRNYSPPELEPVNAPIFSFSGTADNSPVEHAAGIGYMAQSLFAVDSLGITYYEGSLTTCEGCPPVVSFRWRSSDEANPDLTSTVMDNAPPYRYALKQDTHEVYDVVLKADPFGSVNSYTWTVLGNVYTTPWVELSIDAAPDLTAIPVTLEVEYDDGCISATEDTVFLPNHGCDCQIRARQLDSLVYEYRGLTKGPPSFVYSWLFESGTTAPSREVTHQFAAVPVDGVEEIRLNVEVGQCRASARYNQYFDQAVSACAVNFVYTVDTRQVTTPSGLAIDLGEIELEYRSADGTLYRSMLVEQDQNAYFNVIQVEEYVDRYVSPEKRSMKVEAEFSCLLSDGTGTMHIEEGKLILPIGLGAD